MSYEGFDEKIDVIDLIIGVLREHEKKLDELVSRLEEAQISGAPVIDEEEQEPRKRALSQRVASADLKRWADFTERCGGARLVAFDIEGGIFKVSALVGGLLYTYIEEIPNIEILYREVEGRARIESIDIDDIKQLPSALRGRLDCGLELDRKDVEVETLDRGRVQKVFYRIDPVVARSWLAYQLGIEEENIFQGVLET